MVYWSSGYLACFSDKRTSVRIRHRLQTIRVTTNRGSAGDKPKLTGGARRIRSRRPLTQILPPSFIGRTAVFQAAEESSILSGGTKWYGTIMRRKTLKDWLAVSHLAIGTTIQSQSLSNVMSVVVFEAAPLSGTERSAKHPVG